MRTVEIKTNGKSYLVVDVSANANQVRLMATDGKQFLLCRNTGDAKSLKSVELPEAYYEFVGFASSLSEKEWAGIVKDVLYYGIKYHNYIDEYAPFETATESGKSWLEANGIADWTNPFLLIKKK